VVELIKTGVNMNSCVCFDGLYQVLMGTWWTVNCTKIL